MIENIALKGHYTIQAIDRKGSILWQREVDNMLMNTVKAFYKTALVSESSPGFKLKYFAFGDGTTAPSRNQTQLASEKFRKQTTAFDTSAASSVKSTIVVGYDDANDFIIREIGAFCGDGATAAANTGIMLSRVVLSEPIEKNENMQLNIVRTDTVSI